MTLPRKKILIYVFIAIAIAIAIAICLLLFIIFKPKKEKFEEEDFDDTPPFIRGINLDTTTVNASAPDLMYTKFPDKFPEYWPLTQDKIQNVRTYSIHGNNLAWLRYLTNNDVRVFIGITNISDVNTLISELKTWTTHMLNNIIGYSVANEPAPNQTNVNNMIKTYKELKNQLATLNSNYKNFSNSTALNQPVTACLKYGDWEKNGKFTDLAVQLFKVLDPVICFNTYGLLFSTNANKTADQAKLPEYLSWSPKSPIVNQINDLNNLIKKFDNSGKYKLWITETGWTSAKSTPQSTHPYKPSGNGWATPANQKTFYTNFLNAPTNQGIVWPEYIFWFTIRDSAGEFFGLYSSDTKELTPKIK
jgi:hypothetical protein